MQDYLILIQLNDYSDITHNNKNNKDFFFISFVVVAISFLRMWSSYRPSSANVGTYSTNSSSCSHRKHDALPYTTIAIPNLFCSSSSALQPWHVLQQSSTVVQLDATTVLTCTNLQRIQTTSWNEAAIKYAIYNATRLYASHTPHG